MIFYRVPAGYVIVHNNEKYGFLIRGPEHENPSKEEVIINRLCDKITDLELLLREAEQEINSLKFDL